MFFPLKLLLGMGDLDYHLTHGSLGPPKSTTQTTCRSVAVFAGLTVVCICICSMLMSVTDRPTDYATQFVTTGRIYVHGTMWPNKVNVEQAHHSVVLTRKLGHRVEWQHI